MRVVIALGGNALQRRILELAAAVFLTICVGDGGALRDNGLPDQ